MESDVVNELRNAIKADPSPWDVTLYERAASEIEQLRAEVNSMAAAQDGWGVTGRLRRQVLLLEELLIDACWQATGVEPGSSDEWHGFMSAYEYVDDYLRAHCLGGYAGRDDVRGIVITDEEGNEYELRRVGDDD